MVFKWISKILAVINANTRPAHVAGGIAFGLLLALVPAGNLLWIFLLAITFFLKINTAMQFIFLGIFKLITPLLAGLSHVLGWWLLTLPGLKPFFTWFNNVPLLPFTRFNNTLVTGGLFLGLILWIPVFLLCILLLKLYRQHLREKITNTKLVKNLTKVPLISKFLKAYDTAAGAFGETG